MNTKTVSKLPEKCEFKRPKKPSNKNILRRSFVPE